MPKITDEPLKPVLVLFYERDIEKLKTMYKGNIGVSAALRAILRTYIRNTEAKADEAINIREEKEQVTL